MRGTKPHLRVEPDPLLNAPAPDWMSEDAKAEWDRVVPILTQRKILTEADRGSVENYCMAIGTIREMDRIIQKQGAVQMVYKIDKEGNAVLTSARKHPAVAVRSEAITQSRLLAAELGATPVSRSRPTVAKEDDDDELFGWQGYSS
ncbi:phage terminase small subunit P27 family [Thioclava sp. BHET1]|nr:phage terminase small subunit P27 family [Thioclava sp. BHET1]